MLRCVLHCPILRVCLGKGNLSAAFIGPRIGQSNTLSYSVARLFIHRPVSTRYKNVISVIDAKTVMLVSKNSVAQRSRIEG